MKDIDPSPGDRTKSPGRPRGRKAPLWALLLGDVVIAALILGIFFVFYYMAPGAIVAEPPASTPTPSEKVTAADTGPAAAPTSKPIAVPAATPTVTLSASLAATPAPIPTPSPTVLPQHFSDRVISTETSYTSPDISVEMSTHHTELDGRKLCYHVADIYISRAECLQTRYATGELDFYKGEPALMLDRSSSAIVAINGDYSNTQKSGLLIRNGELLLSGQNTMDICVMYKDGSIETYSPGEYTEEEIMSREPWQLWKFGPKLLDENGQPCTVFNTSAVILGENPRSGLGYYEPGHYCFVVVDGRQKDLSEGLTMEEFARLFAQLGCVRAYNMDGGDSAVMTFNDSIYSRPSGGGRSIGDILLICETDKREEQG